MTVQEAQAEVFWMAFKALHKKEREAVVSRLLSDEEFREDLMDIALIAQARHETGEDMPLQDYIAQQSQQR